MKAESRFWMSWEQPTEDHRPLTYPPNDAILGWWCSGYTSDDEATLCALVKQPTIAAAKKAVKKDWPEAHNWRFAERVENDWIPGDRFPIDGWCKERIEKERGL